MEKPFINTPKGVGQVDEIYVSELGFLMIRVYYTNGTYMSYNFGKHDVNNNIFTNKILKDENSELSY